ncbi:MAG: pantetheine-phosphate adenylyltransferase [Bacillota bacterium]|jgi:pantetheine-phosphate adenylyltransferase|nr:pantetheine-phosphate adenylyltransferase [Bacillota bacterium]NLM07813.1 pantetheine-phosphate adenylyltransferase [Clostridiales Family XIII bacterium]HOA42853.1 pantetheine-phosphate adenylyltransferase [Bacillota bacterium]HPZ59392.1 pantetheine-phosphate adenylyltransferase [Bacillota bacterium]
MRKALYAGTFDPITNGHLDLIKRASKLCEHLVVGVMENQAKKPFFTSEERVKMIRGCTKNLPNVEVIRFDGLLADYVNNNQIDAVIRGLRATMDFEYEIQMAHMNARLYNKDVETVFLMTTPEYSFISSSIVKEVFSFNGDISGLVPKVVLKELKRKFNK